MAPPFVAHVIAWSQTVLFIAHKACTQILVYKSQARYCHCNNGETGLTCKTGDACLIGASLLLDPLAQVQIFNVDLSSALSATDRSIVHRPPTAVPCNMTVFAAWVDYVDTSPLLIFLVVFLCGLWLLITAGGPANLPPGPKSWPVIGNADVFWNNRQLYLTFTELAKTYGEMFHLRIGRSTHIVVLTGNDVIREAFVDKAEYFSNIPNFFPIVRYMSNGKGKMHSFNVNPR